MRPCLRLRPASGESRFGESAHCQEVTGGSKGRGLGLRIRVIDRWREPTGQEPSLEGDEAGGDDEDTKDVPPDSYSQCGRSNEGSRCPALIYTISAAGLTPGEKTNAEKGHREEANAKEISIYATADTVLSGRDNIF